MKKSILPITLLMITAVCFGLWFLRSHSYKITTDYMEIPSQNGVWDLSGIDFDNTIVRLTGDGETIVNELMTPQEFSENENRAILGGYKTAKATTTRMQILLPEGNYMVFGENVDTATRLYIDGIWRQDFGQPGLDKKTSKPQFALFSLEVESKGGALNIVRQSSNFTSRNLRDPVDILIARPRLARQVQALQTDLVGFVIGLFFLLFLCHGLLFFILHRYRVNMYFSLLCLVWCLRTGASTAAVFPSWFPAISWQVWFRMEYMLVGLAAVFVMLIIGAVFPGTLPRWLEHFILWFSVAYIILCIVTPTLPLSYLWLPCAIVFIICGVIMAVRFLKDLHQRIKSKTAEAEQWIMMTGILFLFVTILHDVFYFEGFTLFGVLNDLGFLVFALFQMVANLYGTVRDVKKTQAAEEEARLESETLRRASAMKEDFLHDLSHELQMPITVVSGFAQLTEQMLKDKNPDLTAISDNMRRVDDEAIRMANMVSALLDEAALDNGSFILQRERVDVSHLLNDAAAIHFPIMDNNKNQIIVRTDNNLMVNADRERLLQILLNLLSNAVKHTENGTVTISAKPAGNMVNVSVADTGSGIPPELLPKLFKRFAKHSEIHGNGLGLYLCKRFVEAHGGQISIESENGNGTTVCFTMPVWEE